MISKTEISGLLGRMSFQSGWSRKISKRKWLILQILFGVVCVTSILFVYVYFVENADFLRALVIGNFIVIFAGLFSHKEWNRDQQKIQDKESEETVTL